VLDHVSGLILHSPSSVGAGQVLAWHVPVYLIAQEQLGHSSISTTLNIYTHVVDASHRQAIEALERELFKSVPKLPDGDKPADPASRDVAVA
jgi:hypothetical protein